MFTKIVRLSRIFIAMTAHKSCLKNKKQKISQKWTKILIQIFKDTVEYLGLVGHALSKHYDLPSIKLLLTIEKISICIRSLFLIQRLKNSKILRIQNFNTPKINLKKQKCIFFKFLIRMLDFFCMFLNF